MTMPETERTAWHDRFREPAIEALLSAIPPSTSEPCLAAREGLLAIEGVTEHLAWEGVPWRWCLRYHVPAAAESEHHPKSRSEVAPSGVALAYLVPEPAAPKLCIPLPTPVIAALKPRQIARGIREGILASSPVDGLFWPTWPLQTKSGVEELLALVRFRLGFDTRSAPPSAPADS